MASAAASLANSFALPASTSFAVSAALASALERTTRSVTRPVITASLGSSDTRVSRSTLRDNASAFSDTSGFFATASERDSASASRASVTIRLFSSACFSGGTGPWHAAFAAAVASSADFANCSAGLEISGIRAVSAALASAVAAVDTSCAAAAISASRPSSGPVSVGSVARSPAKCWNRSSISSLPNSGLPESATKPGSDETRPSASPSLASTPRSPLATALASPASTALRNSGLTCILWNRSLCMNDCSCESVS